MTDIISRLKQLIDDYADGSVAKFARKTNLTDSAVRGWLAAAAPNPTFDSLDKICRELRISADWLVLGKGSPTGKKLPPPDVVIVGPHDPQARAAERFLRAVPILDDAAAAGPARAINEYDINDWAAVPELLYKENQRALWVTGDSMEPTLTDHSLVGVDVLEGLDPVAFRRRIIAARHEGGVVVKRLECDDKHLILLSDNPRYQPIVMDNDAAQDAVIGPVVWVWQQL